MFHGPDDPVYTISVAARLLGVTPQFLRQIENEGLLTPARTGSNIRLYSDSDLKILARIIYLWRECGVNPQGIRVIIAMEEGDEPSQQVPPRPPGNRRQRQDDGSGNDLVRGNCR